MCRTVRGILRFCTCPTPPLGWGEEAGQGAGRGTRLQAGSTCSLAAGRCVAAVATIVVGPASPPAGGARPRSRWITPFLPRWTSASIGGLPGRTLASKRTRTWSPGLCRACCSAAGIRVGAGPGATGQATIPTQPSRRVLAGLAALAWHAKVRSQSQQRLATAGQQGQDLLLVVAGCDPSRKLCLTGSRGGFLVDGFGLGRLDCNRTHLEPAAPSSNRAWGITGWPSPGHIRPGSCSSRRCS